MKDLSNDVMIHKKSGEIQYLQFRRLLEYEEILFHAFTTRLGGVSIGHNSTLNFSFNEDERENVLKNYEIICDEFNIDIKDIICTFQQHSDKVEIVTRYDKGAGISQDYISKVYDGIITNDKDTILQTVSADCNLILLFDPVRKVIANIHAGWRGVANNIIKNAIEQLNFYYGCNLQSIIACCGPSLNACCFEFDKSDLHHFERYKNVKDFILQHKYENKCYIDLSKVLENQLMESGIKKENIEMSNICTMCNKDTFFSYRGDNGKTGRQAMLIGLK